MTGPVTLDAAAVEATVARTVEEHWAHVGSITGAWCCPCGVSSTNGSIRTNDLTTHETRLAERRTHVAAAIVAALTEAADQ